MNALTAMKQALDMLEKLSDNVPDLDLIPTLKSDRCLDLVERLRMNYVGYNDIPMGNGTLSRGHAGVGQTVKPVGLCEEAAEEITRLRKIEAAAKELYQEEQNVAARETFEKVSSCEKDAERYRWLRNTKDIRACTTCGIVTWFPTGTVIMKGGFFLDAAIDAAIAKEELEDEVLKLAEQMYYQQLTPPSQRRS